VYPGPVGDRYRLAYMTELRDFTSDGGFTRTMAHQVDVDAGTAAAHDFGEQAMPGECVVAPRPGGTSEEDAWALLLVHQRDGSSTELAIDAARVAAPPVARVRLPARVPFGLHGGWLADAAPAS
jgi:carotenoid cleavage dioxygenase-like enzyme